MEELLMVFQKKAAKVAKKSGEYVATLKDGFHSFIASALKLPFPVTITKDIVDVDNLKKYLEDKVNGTVSIRDIIRQSINVKEDDVVAPALDTLFPEDQGKLFKYLTDQFKKLNEYIKNESANKANKEFIRLADQFAADKFEV